MLLFGTPWAAAAGGPLLLQQQQLCVSLWETSQKQSPVEGPLGLPGYVSAGGGKGRQRGMWRYGGPRGAPLTQLLSQQLFLRGREAWGTLRKAYASAGVSHAGAPKGPLKRQQTSLGPPAWRVPAAARAPPLLGSAKWKGPQHPSAAAAAVAVGFGAALHTAATRGRSKQSSSKCNKQQQQQQRRLLLRRHMRFFFLRVHPGNAKP